MILDHISNASRYFDGGRLEQALRALQSYTIEDFTGSRRVIDGDNIFFMHFKYETQPSSSGIFEAHRKYVDIMLMMEGCEAIYHKSLGQLECVTHPYIEDEDSTLANLDSDASKVILTPGNFVVFFPEDAHCPGIDAFGKTAVKKVIAKVKL